MTFDDFNKWYNDVQICMIHDEFKYTYLKTALHKKRGGFCWVICRELLQG